MSQLKRNLYRDALLIGRTFEFDAPYQVEECIKRLEQRAATWTKMGLRLSNLREGVYEFELRHAMGNERIGRGGLKASGNDRTLVEGHIGDTRFTNIIILAFLVIGLVLIWTADYLTDRPVIALALSVLAFVIALGVAIDRLRTFDSWLRQIQDALS